MLFVNYYISIKTAVVVTLCYPWFILKLVNINFNYYHQLSPPLTLYFLSHVPTAVHWSWLQAGCDGTSHVFMQERGSNVVESQDIVSRGALLLE